MVPAHSRTLTDVLREAMERPDSRCGPGVDYMDLLFRFSDVQKQPERQPARARMLPVILGTTGEVRSYTLP